MARLALIFTTLSLLLNPIWAVDFKTGKERPDPLSLEILPSLLIDENDDTGERKYGVSTLSVEVISPPQSSEKDNFLEIPESGPKETGTFPFPDRISETSLSWPGDPSLASFRLGMVHDSNVFEYGDRSRLPTNLADGRFEMDFSLGKSIATDHSLSYHFTGRSYHEFDQLDVIGNEIRYSFSLDRGKHRLLIPFGLQQFHQGGSSLFKGWEFSPAFFRQHRWGRETLLLMTSVQVSHRSYHDVVFKGFDGRRYSLLLKEIWMLRSGKEFGIRGRIDSDDLTDSSQESRDVAVGIEWSGDFAWEGWSYQASADLLWRHNRGVLLLDTFKRKDDGIGASLIIEAPVPNGKINMGYHYRDNSSNLSRYNYEQGQFFLFWKWTGEE